MICSCRIFCWFLLLIQYAWSARASNFDKYRKRDSDLSVAEKQYELMIAQEYSWQRLQINKYGLPRCTGQNNPCRQIGIIGAGKPSL